MADRSNIKPAESSDAFSDPKTNFDDLSSVDSSKEESFSDATNQELPEGEKDAATSNNGNAGTHDNVQGGGKTKKMVDLTSKRTKKARTTKAEKKSFEEMFLSIQERQLSLEENKGKMETQKMSI